MTASMLILSGKIELKPFGDVVSDSLFLGTDIPLAAFIQMKIPQGQLVHCVIEIEGTSTKEVTGQLDRECQFIGQPFKGSASIERLRVGEKDLMAYLTLAAGRSARLSVRALEPR